MNPGSYGIEKQYGFLEFGHPCYVCGNEVICNKSQNTTRFYWLDCSYGVSKTTCFGLYGGHHQVFSTLATGDY